MIIDYREYTIAIYKRGKISNNYNIRNNCYLYK